MSDATEQIRAMIEFSREEARTAEREFDCASEQIAAMAGRDMDLFAGSTMDAVAEIARASRRACDTLYFKYQMLIPSLDRHCRPLLSQHPEDSVILELAELIKWLNDESEIENNFTSSLNGYNLGEIVKAKYYPSVENKMIQKFWESEYGKTFTAQENAKKEIEQLQKEKVEFGRAKRAYGNQLSQYEQDFSDWESAVDEIKQGINEKIKKEIGDRKTEHILEEKNRYQEEHTHLLEEKKTAVQELAARKEYLQSLGFFKFREKKETEQCIENLTKKLQKYEDDLQKMEKRHQRTLSKISRNYSEEEKKLREKLQKEYPLPVKPSMPAEPSKSRNMIRAEIEKQFPRNADVVEALYFGTKAFRRYTLSELMEEIPQLQGVSREKLSACIRGLRAQGKVKRTMKDAEPLYEFLKQ